ncbi:MFS family permease [Agromyces hippuratus]|uniref:MFS family permease n=1 Tax=Agromyces hippuratus TaxID=286438 RepID=A0A852WQW9_9MICO|nr:MFS transporter [Agromyces hippuratus]NYG20389.1 MFS family permease [Agromyces hippuratus]
MVNVDRAPEPDPLNAPLEPAEAGRVPTGPVPSRVSIGWLLRFALAWFGLWLLVMLPGQFMMAKIAEVVAPDDKVALTAFLLGETSVVIMVSVPVFGVLSDRTRLRGWRRRSWILGGFLLAGISFALVGIQRDPVVIAVLMALVSLGYAAVIVSLSAVIADQVPRFQRGRASAAMGVPQVLALAIGMVIVTMLVPDVGGSWAIVGVLALACALPFILASRDPEPPADAATTRFSAALRIPPLGPNHDYYWAMTSRVLVNAGNMVGTTYLLYFLSDVLKVDDPDTGMLVLILVYLVACGLSGWLGGLLSDRLRIRRMFVLVAAALQAAAALVLAIVPTWDASIAAAVLLGLGYGVFLSVDQALVTDVLPDRANRARDLGLINAAQHLPIAPLVAWLVLSVAGYRELYAVAAVIMLLGGILIYRVRSVR